MGKLRKLSLGLLASLWLAACAVPTSPPATETPPTPTRVPASATPAFTPTVMATATVRSTRTPRALLLPAGGWNLPAREIQPEFMAHFQRWENNTQLEMKLGARSVIVDVESNHILTATPRPTPMSTSEYALFSANQEVYAECVDQQFLQVRNVSTNQILWKKESTEIICYFMAWAKNKTRLAFVMREASESELNAFVWSMGDPEPKIVTENLTYEVIPFWSPDSEKLAVFEAGKTAEGEYDAGLYTFRVVYADGRPSVSAETQLSTNNGGESIRWVTADVFANSHGCGGGCWADIFINANTGKELASNIADYYDCGFAGEELAPNQRWLMLEDAKYDWATSDNPTCEFAYKMVDLKSAQTYPLIKSRSINLQLLAWSPDSSTFYTISRPVSETAQASAEVPFGLLALNPQTRTFAQLFEQAVFAQLSPDQARAWVAFPAKREDGSLGLDGGVFDMQTGTLTARQYVADEVLYGNPAEGALLPVAWNHTGTRLVFADAKGELTLVNVNGETQTLTTSLPTGADWRRDARLEWSPDDTKLLVQAGERAWVVEVP